VCSVQCAEGKRQNAKGKGETNDRRPKTKDMTAHCSPHIAYKNEDERG